MATNYKQMALANQFAQDIVNAARVFGTGAAIITSAVVATNETDGNVYVTLNGATQNTVGAATVIFRNQRGSETSPFTDLPGFSSSGVQPTYTSGVATIVGETGDAANEPTEMGFQTLLSCIALLTRAGQRVEISLVANNADPSYANGKAVTPTAVIEPNVWWTISGRA